MINSQDKEGVAQRSNHLPLSWPTIFATILSIPEAKQGSPRGTRITWNGAWFHGYHEARHCSNCLGIRMNFPSTQQTVPLLRMKENTITVSSITARLPGAADARVRRAVDQALVSQAFSLSPAPDLFRVRDIYPSWCILVNTAREEPWRKRETKSTTASGLPSTRMMWRDATQKVVSPARWIPRKHDTASRLCQLQPYSPDPTAATCQSFLAEPLHTLRDDELLRHFLVLKGPTLMHECDWWDA